MALGGLLEFVMEPPGPPNAPPVLHEVIVFGEPMPLREGGARIEGRVCDDMAEPGRFGAIEAVEIGLSCVACPSPWELSPSSDAISVMRDDVMLGASWELELGSGIGKGLLAGIGVEVGESAIVNDSISYRTLLFESSFGPTMAV